MQSGVHHRLKIRAEVGAIRLHVNLAFGAPWTVIYGPSGSGKTSLLRGMCGVLERGRVDFARGRGGGGWEDLSRMAAEARGLSYAPQGGVLFPHLTVRQNLAFGSRGSSEVDGLAGVFGVDLLSGRMPRALSGGERQRVNLARAFAVPGVHLMLLDEPFTGVDRGVREVLLPQMRELMERRGVPVISVTHDVEEALMLGAEVVRLEDGKVVAQGAGVDVLAEERAKMVEALGQ